MTGTGIQSGLDAFKKWRAVATIFEVIKIYIYTQFGITPEGKTRISLKLSRLQFAEKISRINLA